MPRFPDHIGGYQSCGAYGEFDLAGMFVPHLQEDDRYCRFYVKASLASSPDTYFAALATMNREDAESGIEELETELFEIARQEAHRRIDSGDWNPGGSYNVI